MSQQAKALLTKMTREEKVSLCGGKDVWHLTGIERLNLPEIMMTDGPHGLRKQKTKSDTIGLHHSVKATCFPTASLLASTWDPALIKKMGQALGEESLEEDVSVLLGPGANIKRHPFCGRNFEYFSEDPLLSGKLASAWIKGVQSTGVGASLKHYVANNQETSRMVVDAIIDERTLHELYLKSFEIAVKEAQPKTVMCAYNKVNGTYLAEHKKLLQTTLKDSWKHKGIVVTDWGANNDRVKGIIAGQELEMPSSHGVGQKELLKALDTNQLDESLLDTRVERIIDLILAAKETLAKDHEPCDFPLHHNLAQKIAAEGMVLLKNEENVLPISPNQSVALIGEFAKEPRYQGSGSSLINPKKLTNAFTAFEAVCNSKFIYARGYDHKTDKIEEHFINEAVQTAKQADVVVLMVGLTDDYESEGFDRTHLSLPDNHIALLEAVSQVHDKVIVTLSNGAPVTMPWKEQVKGILEQYLAGEASGEALSDVIFGKVNPSGKLAETFPNDAKELLADQHFPGSPRQVQYREGLFIGYRYYDSINQDPLYPFGFGLSYTTFDIQDVAIHQTKKDIKISLAITNTGNCFGKETIQVYIGKEKSNVYRPKKTLKGFKKIAIESSKTKKVTLTIPIKDLAIYNDGSSKVESGSYTVYVGTSSRDIAYQQEITISTQTTIKKDKASNYKTITKHFKPTTEDFEALLEKPIPPVQSIKPFSMNSTLKEVKTTFIGKRFYKLVKENMLKHLNQSSDEGTRDMMTRMLDGIPLRSLVLFSQGKLSQKRVKGLIDLMNKKVFRGLYKVIIG